MHFIAQLNTRNASLALKSPEDKSLKVWSKTIHYSKILLLLLFHPHENQKKMMGREGGIELNLYCYLLLIMSYSVPI